MHVIIDARFASIPCGLGRYTSSMVAELCKRDDGVHYTLIVHSKTEEWIPQGVETIECKAKHYSLAEQIQLPRILKKLATSTSPLATIFFSPHFNVPLFCPVPFVCTVHDLILHRFPNQAGFFKRLAYKFLIGSTIRRAKRVIAVSPFTAGEIQSVYGVDPIVVGEGIEEHFSPRSSEEIDAVRAAYSLPENYVLYVGNAKQHKNVQTLCDGFAAANLPDTHLVLVMFGSEADAISLPDNSLRLRNVSDDHLPALYSGAKCFCTASLYEGYCLPVVEAAACGCPVIASNKTAIGNIAPQGSVLIEPTVENIAKALQNIPNAPDRSSLPQWSISAKQLVDVFANT